MILPPGSILQKMHFLQQIKRLKPGIFIEIGPGNGKLSEVLLNRKWKGMGIEADKKTAKILTFSLDSYIRKGHYKIIQKDFFKFKQKRKVDLILASMVLEHCEPAKELLFLKKSHFLLKKNGALFCYVPGSPKSWGIEDTVAGHFRRYTLKRLKMILKKCNWDPVDLAGLTFPLSNILLPVSNFLVKRHESYKLKFNLEKKTMVSGRREVPYKTKFPFFLKIFLNQFVLYPFYILQSAFKYHPKNLTIFFKAIPLRKN